MIQIWDAGAGEDSARIADPPAIRFDGAPADDGIYVYGADWCGDTRRSRALLDLVAIPYTDVNVDAHRAANDWAAAQNGGQRRIPVVVVPYERGNGDASVLIEPSDDVLLAVLRVNGYLGETPPPSKEGGGPFIWETTRTWSADGRRSAQS